MYEEISEDLLIDFMDAVDNNTIMDFMGARGWEFTQKQLISIIKELDYAVHQENRYSNHRGYDVVELKENLLQAFEL